MTDSANNASETDQTLDVGDESAVAHGTKTEGAIRFATFNLALNRKAEGDLATELASRESEQAKWVAEVIQRVRPDVLVINELDYQGDEGNLKLFVDHYLAVGQNGQPPIEFAYQFVGPVNTGVDSGLDLNGDGQTGNADDAFGYGAFPGQYGMAVLSNLEFDRSQVRTFGKLLWKSMEGALQPINDDGTPYYSDEIMDVFRLSSKSHWVVPLRVDEQTIHLLVAHPTPPVFDGPEDRNGKRNHDEIRLLADLIDGADYLVDDQGVRGGIESPDYFVVAGDLNADPNDGDSENNGIHLLLGHDRVNASFVPSSRGAVEAAALSGGANSSHQGDPAHDTGDFNDETAGNLRADYVLPSKSLKVVGGGVFWPEKSDSLSYLNEASDHHLVWIDVRIQSNAP